MRLPDGYTDLEPGKLANVVTCFEMRERPSLRPEPAYQGLELARVEKPDLAWYRDLFRRVGEPYLWFSRLSLDDERLRAVVHNECVEVYAVRRDESDAGLLELDFRIDRECELTFFGLVGSEVGRGAGRWLMNRAIEHAWARPIERMWLHTCSLDHPSAVPFYLRSGFRPYKRQIEIYDDPRLLGLLSESAAPEVPLIR